MAGPQLVTAAGLSDRHRTRWADGGAVAAVAEALRRDLLARGAAVRRALCGRALTYLSPLVPDLGGEAVGDVLDDLERCGDALTGAGGWVAAAPLRAVWLGDGGVTVSAGAPTDWLRAGLGDVPLEAGFPRTGRLAPDQEGPFRAGVAALGGLVVTPERWAGLESAPPAGPAFLAELDDRLTSDPAPPEPADWACYRPDAPRNKRWDWHPTAPGRLWKARSPVGGWRHAWTGGGVPAEAPWLELWSDESCRAALALDRAAGNPAPCAVSTADGEVRLEVGCFLPRAEYRFLTTLGRRLPGRGADAAYAVPASRWERVRGALSDRLGLVL